MSGEPSSFFTLQAFRDGSAMRAFEYFGVHRHGDKLIFRVWAPHAQSVSVCGTFTDWATDRLPMRRVCEQGEDTGVWELCLCADRVRTLDQYKFFIRSGCQELYKADPYGVYCEAPPATASVIYEINDYCWRDAGWLSFRMQRYAFESKTRQPVNVYQMHVGSWKCHDDGCPYSYRELVAELVTYVKQMGYSHIGLMPIYEHASLASWGYEATGYYAATARYGEPKDLMAFIDTMHEAGIGVILDWVPTVFSNEMHGPCAFDGQPLYESDCSESHSNADPGACRFDLQNGAVQSFLLSNLLFWIEKYHVDGIRIVARPDFDGAGAGTAVAPELSGFLEKLCLTVEREHPDVLMIVEDGGASKGVNESAIPTKAICFRPNTACQRQVVAYLSEPPFRRKYLHADLHTCADLAQRSRCLFLVSHSEAAIIRRLILEHEQGDRERKFAVARTFFTYMMTHPGKKLTYMGLEIGQLSADTVPQAVDWRRLDDEMRARLQLFVAELNHLYLENPAFWACDGEASGFEWIDSDEEEGNLLSYRRRDAAGNEVTVLLNFTPAEYSQYRLVVAQQGIYRELLNTDSVRYGGKGRVNAGDRQAECNEEGADAFLRVRVAPMSAAVFGRSVFDPGAEPRLADPYKV